MKRLLGLLLAAALLLSCMTALTFATTTPTVTVGTVAADAGATEVKVTIDIADNPGLIGAKLTVSYDSNLTLTGAKNGTAFQQLSLTKPGTFAQGCSFVWDCTEIDSEDIADGTILTLTFTVSESAPKGTKLPISLTYERPNIRDGNSNTYALTIVNGGITVNGTADSGYTVTPTVSAETVAPEASVDLYLDVANSSETAFNAFYATVTYNKDLFTYGSGTSVNGYAVDATTAGKLVISRYGDAAAISGTDHELTLSFTAGTTEGTGSFAVSSAKVDKASNKESDALSAACGASVSVKVEQPAPDTYTVTYQGGEGATGTAPTQDAVEASTEITLQQNTFVKTGYTFSGWLCDIDQQTYNAGEKYVMTAANTTFTAQWTANWTATAVKTDFLSGYTLISITGTPASGNVFTYAGQPMYQIASSGVGTYYDATTWYYVASGSVANSAVSGNISEAAGTAELIQHDGDVNLTDLVDINDAQMAYDIYTNQYAPAAKLVQKLLEADVNGDGTVNAQDAAAVVGKIG